MGEGLGVRAAPLSHIPHPSPLPKGEGIFLPSPVLGEGSGVRVSLYLYN